MALCTLLPRAAYGESAREVNEQFQFWASVNRTTRVTKRLGVIADFHVRRNDFLAEPSFSLLRFGAHYWLTEKPGGEPVIGETNRGQEADLPGPAAVSAPPRSTRASRSRLDGRPGLGSGRRVDRGK